ncbi:DUF934 domain-containing protein [Saccharospirillum impatiens]|uniref:DUF934 domain-containing protein n=1 Tax=Saccharospirillum impatiens TaxID=169438 RepID=UPI0004176917|nr:DUF934 domain-containing protein [Saccharospirillum impatiens]
MQNLIKDGQLQHDDWALVEEDTPVPASGPVILPLAVYRGQKSEWDASDRNIGVWLNDEQMAEDVTDSLDKLALIALRFPKFADGRGFSKARLLRERHAFAGEIRAIGDFLPDQVFYMGRCGINAFACRTDEEASIALALFAPFSVRYQGGTDSASLFEQR